MKKTLKDCPIHGHGVNALGCYCEGGVMTEHEKMIELVEKELRCMSGTNRYTMLQEALQHLINVSKRCSDCARLDKVLSEQTEEHDKKSVEILIKYLTGEML